MNKVNPQISVLMPLYNVEKYVNMSIDSVLKQTFEDFELIIINDGSTDESAIIAETYSKDDERIKIYHIENKGLANVRNLALSYANGEYITFVDSDDAIDADYLELLMKGLDENDADISFCSFSRYVESEKMYYFDALESGYRQKLFTPQEIYENYYNSVNGFNISLVTAWGKLFKKSLFNCIHFPTGKFFEDSYTIYKLFLLADRIVYINKAMYMYRITDNSIMTSEWTREKIQCSVEQHEERLALLATIGYIVSEDNKKDYRECLRRCMDIALKKGYIEEFHRLKGKFEFICKMDSKNNK